MRGAKLLIFLSYLFCCCEPLAHFLSWAAVLCPRASWPPLVWALVSQATLVKSWFLITQTFPKPTFASSAPDRLLAGFHMIFYYDYYSQKKKKDIMKIYLNLWINGEMHQGQALNSCFCKRVTQQSLFMATGKRLSVSDGKFSTRNEFSCSLDICLVRGQEILRFSPHSDCSSSLCQSEWTTPTSLRTKYIKVPQRVGAPIHFSWGV